MVDQRFFPSTGPHRLSKIVELIGAEPIGAEAQYITINDVASLELATATDISVFFERKLRDHFVRTAAAAVVTSQEIAGGAVGGSRLLLVRSPRLAYMQVCELFYPETPLEGRIDRATDIDPSA